MSSDDSQLFQHTRWLALIESTTLADVVRRNSDQPGSLDGVHDDLFYFHM